MGRSRTPTTAALVSAVLFGLSTPLAKRLVMDITPIVLAGLLYLGAFAGLALYSGISRVFWPRRRRSSPLGGKDWGWLALATAAGGVAGPISLMTGLRLLSGSTTSLLLNLEGAATAVLAVIIFGENAGRRLWASLGCMAVAGVLLSWDPGLGRFNGGGLLLVVLAMVFWGLDNNFTCRISDKNPVVIALIKGLAAGLVSLGIAVFLRMDFPDFEKIALAMLVGAFCYGLSLVLFILALKGLGASRVSVLFGTAPFVGAAASLLFLGERVGWVLVPSTLLMLLGAWLLWSESHGHVHDHEGVTHFHAHFHDDGHHGHPHPERESAPHAHEHTHEAVVHDHPHHPDSHHRHRH